MASTPSFTGGTPTVKTGTPAGGGTTTMAAVRPSIALTGGLPDPRPHVAVDDAGTAYVTWILSTSPTSKEPGGIGFCRLPRGASACTNPPATQVLKPAKDYGSGDDPAYNQDARSGAYPLVLGDQLFILSTRDITTYQTPAGESTTTTIAFVSTDGGSSFSGGVPISSDLVLTARPAAFGSDDNPLIGLLGPSGGFFGDIPVSFGSVAGGSFSAGGFRLGSSEGGVANFESPDALAPLPGGGIAAAWASDPSDGGGGRFLLSSDTATVRQFPGPGAPAGEAAFTPAKTFPFGPAQETGPQTYEHASLASSKAGLLVGTIGGGSPALGLRPLLTPVAGGAPISLSTEKAAQLRLATAGDAPGGQVVAAWLDITDFVDGKVQQDSGLHVRRSVDGKTFTAPERLTLRSGGIDSHEEAAAPDGGGFSVMQTDADAGGTVRIVPFGPQGKSALPGLPGTVPGVGVGGPGGGGPVDDGVIRECERIAVGAVQVTTDNGVGCFLPGVGANKGKSVSNGPVLYNGLRITPLNGAQIVIDIHTATKAVTLYTTKQASVEIPAGGDGGDIEIYRGQLKQKLTAKEGQPVLDLPKYPTTVRGFKVASELSPLALKGGVRIPVDLDLGAQFLGLTGHAELVVDPKTGLKLDTLRIAQDVLPLGPVVVSDLEVTWTKSGGLWTGKAKVTLPTGSAINVQVSFDNSSFTANASYTPIPPIALFGPPPVVFLHEFHAGLEVNRNKKPLVLSGGVKVGALPLSPSTYVLDLDGTVTLTFADPFVFEVRGDLELFSTFDIASAYLRAGSDRIVKSTFTVGIGSESWAYIGGNAAVAVGPPGFEGTLDGKICAGIGLVSYCQPLPSMYASSKGLAGCAGFLGSRYTITKYWGGGLVRRKGKTCFYDDLSVGLLRAAAGTRAAGSSEATVPPGADVLNLNVQTASGVPDVTVSDPSGLSVDLSGPGVEVSSSASEHAMSIAIDKPAAGRWAVIAADGAPALTGVQASVPAPAPVLKATLAPRPVAGQRVVQYEVTANPDVTATFIERTTAGDVPLPGGGRSGTVRLRPNPMVPGRHVVVARLRDAGGIVLQEQIVGSFVQPPLPRPRAPRAVRVVRSGTGYRVTVVPSSGFAGRHVVTARFGEGGRASGVLAAGARSVRIAGPAKSLDAPGPTRIAVQAVSAAGVRGPARVAVARVAGLQRRPVARRPRR